MSEITIRICDACRKRITDQTYFPVTVSIRNDLHNWHFCDECWRGGSNLTLHIDPDYELAWSPPLRDDHADAKLSDFGVSNGAE